MTTQNAKELPFTGPWRGLITATDDRRTPVGALSEAKNVVIDKGDISVRPGGNTLVNNMRAAIIPESADIIPISNTLFDVAVSSTTSYIYYTRNSTSAGTGGIWYKSKGTGGTPPVRGLAVSFPGALVITSSSIFYVVGGDGIYTTTTAWAAPSKVVDLSSIPTSFITQIAHDQYGSPQYIYLAAQDAAGDKILKADLTAGTFITLVTIPSTHTVRGVATDPSTNKIWYMATHDTTNVLSIWTNNKSGTAEVLLATHTDIVSGKKLLWNPLLDELIFSSESSPSVYGHVRYVKASGGPYTDTDFTTIYQGRDYNRQLTRGDLDYAAQRIYMGFILSDTPDREFLAWIPANVRTHRIISSFKWDRTIHGVSDQLPDDIILIQIYSGGWSYVTYALWRPKKPFPFDIQFIEPGIHTFGDGTDIRPDIFGNPDRDTIPLLWTGIYDTVYQEHFGRATYAYMGLGLTTAKGGVLVANGEGLHVFNYVLGNTIQTISFSAIGSLSVKLFGIIVLDHMDNGWPDFVVRDQIQSSPVVDQVSVSKTGAVGSEVFTIEFQGGLSGQNVEPMVVVSSGGTGQATVAVVRAGGTEVGHKLYMREHGLPTPPKPTITHDAAPPQTGKINGVYSWKMSWYSAQLGIESPSSIRSDYAQEDGVNGSAKVSWVLPATQLFDRTGWPHGRVVSHVRLYRRRHGNYGSVTAPDGVGASANWQLIEEVQIDGFTLDTSFFYDDIGDDETTTRAAPIFGYASDKAQYVETHASRSFILDNNPGEQRLSWSELPDPLTGELGHELFRLSSRAILENTRASDHKPTGLKGFREFLIVFTNKECFIVNPQFLSQGTLSARRVAGGAGCASHWCIVETEALPELGARLLYPNHLGRIYEFNGSDARILSEPIYGTTQGLNLQTWQDTEKISLYGDNWYWASAVLDEDRKRVYISTFEQSATSPRPHIQICYDLRTKAFTTWDMSIWNMFSIRDWQSGVNLAKPLVVYSDNTGGLMKLLDESDDSGTAISWSIKTGKMDMGHPTTLKVATGLVLGFEMDKQGATQNSVQVEMTPDGKAAVALTTRNIDREFSIYANRLDARCRTIQYRIFGTQLSTEDIFRMISMSTFYIPLPRVS